MIPLIAIVGPTAIGKSALALRLAERFGGEIVNADSRQVYRGMDIGTGKPTAAERGLVPHHLLDLVDPDEDFNVALYLQQAVQTINGTHERGKLSILVGGTGHYVWALLEGLRIPQVPPDAELRATLNQVADSEGGQEKLMAELTELDPVGASRIDARNTRRVVRAIEVSRAAGRPFSEVGTREPPPYRTLILGLTAPRELLYGRIDARVDAMVQAGWADEVEGLLARGYSPDLSSFLSLGYRDMAQYVRGELDLPGAVQRIKTQTHAFARRQYAWFKPTDSRIVWFDITDSPEEHAIEAVQKWEARPSLDG